MFSDRGKTERESEAKIFPELRADISTVYMEFRLEGTGQYMLGYSTFGSFIGFQQGIVYAYNIEYRGSTCKTVPEELVKYYNGDIFAWGWDNLPLSSYILLYYW